MDLILAAALPTSCAAARCCTVFTWDKLNRMDQNTDTALKNAWNTVLATSDELKAVTPDAANLEAVQPKVLAQAIAAQALRGLVEELRRTAEKGE